MICDGIEVWGISGVVLVNTDDVSLLFWIDWLKDHILNVKGHIGEDLELREVLSAAFL